MHGDLPLMRATVNFEQVVPVSVMDRSRRKAHTAKIIVQWDALAQQSPGAPPLAFRFEETLDAEAEDSYQPQLFVASLCGAIAWAQPWPTAAWTIRNASGYAGSAACAALATALVATSAGLDYPQDTLVLGFVLPDNTLGPVTSIRQRLESAAAAGVRRVVIPEAQKVEMDSFGRPVDIVGVAKRLALEPVLASSVEEAIHLTLQVQMPQQPLEKGTPAYRPELFSAFVEKCAAIAADLGDKPAASKKTTTSQQRLYYEKSAQDSLQDGRPYAALRQYQLALAAAQQPAEEQATPAQFREFNERVNGLRHDLEQASGDVSLDKNGLLSAVVMAERGEWFDGLLSRVEGPQRLAVQAFAPGAHATQQKKHEVFSRLVRGEREARVLLPHASLYGRAAGAVAAGAELEIYGRGAIWLPRLMPAYLGRAEFFFQGLQAHASELGEQLPSDPKIAALTLALRRHKTQWEKTRTVPQRQQVSEGVVLAGFVPGSAYAPPKVSVSGEDPSSLWSDPAKCMAWVNLYCELAALEQKYLLLRGSFDEQTGEWTASSRASLERLVQNAEQGAREGIYAASQVGVAPDVFAMIFERAGALRASDRHEDRLEGLKQYWRCGLMGQLCWQLAFVPKAAATPSAPRALPVGGGRP